jgi:hypothetical protein
MFRAAIALLALAAPALAQHGGARAGSFGGRGFAGHAGFTGHAGFSSPGGFARPAPPMRYGAPASAGFRGFGPAPYANGRFLTYGNGYGLPRASYRSMADGASGTWTRGQDRDRNRFNARRRSFDNWYVNVYPTWPGYGYPYVIDPGFYDWGDSDDSADGQGGAVPDYAAPYPDQGYGPPGEPPQEGFASETPPWSAPNQQPAARAIAAAPETEPSLTVIFKSGRAPLKIQNYMMTAKALTDLDSRHYEQIPLNQIDVAATRRVNTSAGIDFQVPDASRD